MSSYKPTDILKECPFCGSTEVEVEYEEVIYGCRAWYRVTCMSCFAYGGQPSLKGRPDTPKQAIKMWNCRKK